MHRQHVHALMHEVLQHCRLRGIPERLLAPEPACLPASFKFAGWSVSLKAPWQKQAPAPLQCNHNQERCLAIILYATDTVVVHQINDVDTGIAFAMQCLCLLIDKPFRAPNVFESEMRTNR